MSTDMTKSSCISNPEYKYINIYIFPNDGFPLCTIFRAQIYFEELLTPSPMFVVTFRTSNTVNNSW